MLSANTVRAARRRASRRGQHGERTLRSTHQGTDNWVVAAAGARGHGGDPGWRAARSPGRRLDERGQTPPAPAPMPPRRRMAATAPAPSFATPSLPLDRTAGSARARPRMVRVCVSPAAVMPARSVATRAMVTAAVMPRPGAVAGAALRTAPTKLAAPAMAAAGRARPVRAARSVCQRPAWRPVRGPSVVSSVPAGVSHRPPAYRRRAGPRCAWT